jgi:hypothetical protein
MPGTETHPPLSSPSSVYRLTHTFASAWIASLRNCHILWAWSHIAHCGVPQRQYKRIENKSDTTQEIMYWEGGNNKYMLCLHGWIIL